MKAQIKVASYDTSMWDGFARKECREAVYVVAAGERIDTVGLGAPYRFEITGVRADAVDLLIQPNLWLQAEEGGRVAGALTLTVGERACLQTQSFDAWGHWVVTVEGIE